MTERKALRREGGGAVQSEAELLRPADADARSARRRVQRLRRLGQRPLLSSLCRRPSLPNVPSLPPKPKYSLNLSDGSHYGSRHETHPHVCKTARVVMAPGSAGMSVVLYSRVRCMIIYVCPIPAGLIAYVYHGWSRSSPLAWLVMPSSLKRSLPFYSGTSCAPYASEPWLQQFVCNKHNG